jgi:uncharacterized delta-60 repeat protein
MINFLSFGKKQHLFCLFCLSNFNYVQAQLGSFDNTFNSNGKFFSGQNGSVYEVMVQTDEKIILAGGTYVSSPDFYVSRLNSDGSLDLTFGTAGEIIVDIASNSTEYIRASSIQADGKIIVAGDFSNGFGNDIALMRFNTDGSIDNTFGISGITITDFLYQEYVSSIALQADGKIVIGGTLNSSEANHLVARYNTDGTLDGTFGTGGYVYYHLGSPFSYEKLNSIAIQADGKIVIGGTAYGVVDSDYCLARLLTNGNLDPTFGVGGKALFDIGGSTDVIKSIAIQTDGKIVACGTTYLGGYDEIGLVRYNSDGTLDNTFGSSGITISSAGTATDYANKILLQPDGKIILTGEASLTGDQDVFIARYDTFGLLDNTFGTSGVFITTISSDYDFTTASTLDTDGKVVIAGSFGNKIGAARFLVSCFPTLLVSNPVNDTVCDGGSHYLFVNVQYGHGYQWQVDGGSGFVDLAGENNDSLLINSIIFAMDGFKYRCIYTDNCATNVDTSNFALLNVSTINTSLIQTATNLTANVPGATYQWLDCNLGNSPVAGETNALFSPTANGLYAAQITFNGCVDTSICTAVIGIGIDEINSETRVNIYPNPSTGQFSIESNVQLEDYLVVNVYGQNVFTGKIENNKIDISTLNNGMYELILQNNSGKQVIKTIIKNE